MSKIKINAEDVNGKKWLELLVLVSTERERMKQRN